MSSQVWVPEGTALAAMRLVMAAEVCQNVRIDIQKSTDSSWGLFSNKEKFNPTKYNAHVSKYLKDFNVSLEELSPTEKKIYDIILKDTVALFQNNPAFKKLLPCITEAEHIKNLSASKEIQLQAIATFLGTLARNPRYSHLCHAE